MTPALAAGISNVNNRCLRLIGRRQMILATYEVILVHGDANDILTFLGYALRGILKNIDHCDPRYAAAEAGAGVPPVGGAALPARIAAI